MHQDRIELLAKLAAHGYEHAETKDIEKRIKKAIERLPAPPQLASLLMSLHTKNSKYIEPM